MSWKIYVPEITEEELENAIKNIIPDQSLNQDILFRQFMKENASIQNKCQTPHQNTHKEAEHHFTADLNKRDEDFFLLEKWKEIQKNLKELSDEPYIDDQRQINYIWNICYKELIPWLKVNTTAWKIREEILLDLYLHYFYDEYSCYSPIAELADKLIHNDEERLQFARALKLCFPSNHVCTEFILSAFKNHSYKEYGEFLEVKSQRKDWKRNQLTAEECMDLIEYYISTCRQDKIKQLLSQIADCYTIQLTDLFSFLLERAADQPDHSKAVLNGKYILKLADRRKKYLKKMQLIHKARELGILA